MPEQPECWVSTLSDRGASGRPCWGELILGGDGEVWAWHTCEGHRLSRHADGCYIEQPAVLALAELGRTET